MTERFELINPKIEGADTVKLVRADNAECFEFDEDLTLCDVVDLLDEYDGLLSLLSDDVEHYIAELKAVEKVFHTTNGCCYLNVVVNDLQDELVSTKNRRDELIKQLEDLEYDKIDEHYQQILENKKIVTPWKRFDVAEDLAPLFSALVKIFEEFYDESKYQYKNNLLMLRYHVKSFKEVLDES